MIRSILLIQVRGCVRSNVWSCNSVWTEYRASNPTDEGSNPFTTFMELEKDIPRPEDWKNSDDKYMYEHKETGEKIIEGAYFAKVYKRNLLAEYLSSVEEYNDNRGKISPYDWSIIQ